MNTLLAFLAQFGVILAPPPVHDLSHESLCRAMQTPHCTHVAAVFLVDKPEHNLMRGHVYLSDRVDLSTVKGQSVLLHELVHVYQIQNGMVGDTCQDHYAAERQAYIMQNTFLRRRGHALVKMFLPDCSNEPAKRTIWAPYKGK